MHRLSHVAAAVVLSCFKIIFEVLGDYRASCIGLLNWITMILIAAKVMPNGVKRGRPPVTALRHAPFGAWHYDRRYELIHRTVGLSAMSISRQCG